MSLSVCRLELTEVGTAEQVGSPGGHGRQVGDRPVVRWL